MESRILKAVRGVVCLIIFLLTNFITFMSLHCFPYAIGIALACPPLYRFLTDSVIGYYFVFLAALLECLLGIKVVITGDYIQPGERCLILMNHRTRLDWMYFWSVLVRLSTIFTEKIILKAPLKHVPGAGWAMQCASFIFLDRKWENDKAVLTEMLDYFCNLGHRTQVLLFPEGTDLTPNTKERSDEFARKNNLPYYDYVLHPRVTGFIFLAKEMQKRKMLDAVYDVSIAYPQDYPKTELEMVYGKFPQEVHFHIKRHSTENMAMDENSLADWCRNRWQEKELQLKNYYLGEKKFVGAALNTETLEARASLIYKCAIAYWIFFILGCFLLLYYSWLARLFLLCSIVFFVYMGSQGGWELVQAKYANRLYSKKSK